MQVTLETQAIHQVTQVMLEIQATQVIQAMQEMLETAEQVLAVMLAKKLEVVLVAELE